MSLYSVLPSSNPSACSYHFAPGCFSTFSHACLFDHHGFWISNLIRSFLLALHREAVTLLFNPSLFLDLLPLYLFVPRTGNLPSHPTSLLSCHSHCFAPLAPLCSVNMFNSRIFIFISSPASLPPHRITYLHTCMFLLVPRLFLTPIPFHNSHPKSTIHPPHLVYRYLYQCLVVILIQLACNTSASESTLASAPSARRLEPACDVIEFFTSFT